MLNIPYGNTFIEFDETDASVLSSSISELKAEGSGLEIVRKAMENPIDSPKLSELAVGKKTALSLSPTTPALCPAVIFCPTCSVS